MQHEIISAGRLLNGQGNIAEPGYAKSLISEYHRADIRASKLRIKEWDYYAVVNDECAVALTVADNSYMGMISATLIDFTRPWEHTQSVMTAFPNGKFALPETSTEGNVMYGDKRVQMAFVKDGGKRTLSCRFEEFFEGEALEAHIELDEPPMDSMVIATPFDKPKHFYYNQKINCMSASGSAVFKGKEYVFTPDKSFAVLDWGRGVWTYDNTWHWGSASGLVNSKRFGFNIGYGFGNTSAATENMLFYDGKAHKLNNVTFNIPSDSYTKPWTFTSDDGRFEMDFVPVIDRCSLINALVILTDQHQVFGRFTGKAVLDDGTVLEIKDLMGFAEKVRMKY